MVLLNLRNLNGFAYLLLFAAMKSVTFVYDVLTLPICFILQDPIGKLRKAKQIWAVCIEANASSVTFTSTKKHSEKYKEIDLANIDTLSKLLSYCRSNYGARDCQGTREILEEIDEVQANGAVFKKYRMGKYVWKTYQEVDEEATHFGLGLRELGVSPGEIVIIIAQTRAEWFVAAHGLFKQNIILASLYESLGEEGIIQGINETEATTIITSSDMVPMFKEILRKTTKVRTIIYMENQLKKNQPAENSPKWPTFVSYQDVLIKGAQSNIGTVPAKPNDTALIIYTSGSTGKPKGVIITHKNFITSLKTSCDTNMCCSNEIFLGVLPLAHMFEMILENVIILYGSKIGYSNPLSMFDGSGKLVEGSRGDITTLKPTMIIGVPLLLDRIVNNIKANISNFNDLKKFIFDFAYKYKLKWAEYGFSTPLVDRIIFGEARKLVGGRLKVIITGGAPLSMNTQGFIKTCLCTDLLLAYGHTESTGICTISDVYDTSRGRVGSPMPCTQLRLINWEEGGYKVTDKPFPRGEIFVHSDQVTAGYYKRLEESKNNYFVENNQRWFKSGDIGEIHNDGVLKIIDRKRVLVKLQMGEYIAPGKIESVLKTHPLIDNIFVYGDSKERYCVAIIVPSKDSLLKFAENIGSTHKTFEEVCADLTVLKSFQEEFKNHARKEKLNKYEIPARIKLVTEVWTPESGLLTTSLKLKRIAIQQYYANDIKQMYNSTSM